MSGDDTLRWFAFLHELVLGAWRSTCVSLCRTTQMNYINASKSVISSFLDHTWEQTTLHTDFNKDNTLVLELLPAAARRHTAFVSSRVHARASQPCART